MITKVLKWVSRNVATNMLDCDTVISCIEHQMHYYVHFLTNILGKYTNSFSLSYWLYSTNTVLLQE